MMTTDEAVAEQLQLPALGVAAMRTPGAPGAREATLAWVERHADRFRPEFPGWLAANWHVWQRFVAEACLLWDRGRRHYSARTILHWLRHETALREAADGNGWKINNNASPDLARLYEAAYPERAEFFERRGRD